SDAFDAHGKHLGKVLGGVTIGLQVGLIASEIANALCQHFDNEKCQKAFEVIEPTLRWSLVVTAAAEVVKAVGELNLLKFGLTFIENVKETVGTASGKVAI